MGRFPDYYTIWDKAGFVSLRVGAGLVLAFLMLPILVIIPLSFNNDPYFSFTEGMLALDPEARVMGLVSYAWAGFGAALGPAILLSLYWRRMTPTAALAGILSGGITVVVWKNLSGGLLDLYETYII